MTPSSSSDAKTLLLLDLHCIRQGTGDMMIVFVHGILSSGYGAWGDPSWPELFSSESEFGDASIYVFTYRTGIGSHTYSVSDATNELREQLRLVDFKSKNKLVFVCHSMGGLVVRRLLVANRSEFASHDRVIGLFLVASPSLGSNDATTLSLLSHALQHTQLAALRFSQSNTWLNDLHTDFKALLLDDNLRIEGRELIEDRPITVKRRLGLWRQVVEPFAAAQYFHKRGCEPHRVAGSDHISIAKPLTADAIQHRMLKSFISDFVVKGYEPSLYATDQEETRRAYNAVTRLQAGFDRVETKPEALTRLHHALLETRQYIAGQSAGQRDARTEHRLAQLWNDTGSALLGVDDELAGLCWIKGYGWADQSLWEDPRFRDLPVKLDDMLHRLHLAMQKRADAMPAALDEARKAFGSTHALLNISDKVVPSMAEILNLELSGNPHSVTHRLVDDGRAVEFTGWGEVKAITADDFMKLAPDDRRMIASSEKGMKKLQADFEKILSKGRRSADDEAELIAIAGQMGSVLDLVFGVVETALGGALQDHYATQRGIAQYARDQAAALAGSKEPKI